MSWGRDGSGRARRAGARVPAGRAGALALISTVLAVTAHHLASGGPVPWAVAGGAAVGVWVVGLPLVRVLRSLAGSVAATVAVQAGLHVLLERATACGPSGHDHHAAAQAMPSGADELWHAAHPAGWTMTVLHLLAAVVVAWCLHRADAAVRSAARALVAGARRLRAFLADLGAGSPDVPAGNGAVRRSRRRVPPALCGPLFLLADAVVRRGPPQAVSSGSPRGRAPWHGASLRCRSVRVGPLRGRPSALRRTAPDAAACSGLIRKTRPAGAPFAV